MNGKASTSFSVRSGCRQGDPFSPYLFILCAEVLACKIREGKRIKDVESSGTEFKIRQFAVDNLFSSKVMKTSTKMYAEHWMSLLKCLD